MNRNDEAALTLLRQIAELDQQRITVLVKCQEFEQAVLTHNRNQTHVPDDLWDAYTVYGEEHQTTVERLYGLLEITHAWARGEDIIAAKLAQQ